MHRLKSILGLSAAIAWAAGAGTAYGQHQHEHGEHAEGHAAQHSHDEGAGHSHERAAAHGGSVSMTREFHFESVFLPNEIRVYVYDGDQNPMPAGNWKSGPIKGTVTVQFRDRTKKPQEIKLVETKAKPAAMKHEHGEAADHDHGHAHHDGDGDEHGEHAEHGEHGEHGEHAEHAEHSADTVLWMCPMHPDQNGKAKGKCEKCGMLFTPQDYLSARVDLSDVKPNEAKAVFKLSNLTGTREKQTAFTQKIELVKAHKPHDEHGDHHEHSKP